MQFLARGQNRHAAKREVRKNKYPVPGMQNRSSWVRHRLLQVEGKKLNRKFAMPCETLRIKT